MAEPRVHFLLIEDVPGDARLLHLMLSEVPGFSFKMEHAPTLQAGLNCLRAADFDVVLLDLELPDSSGLGTLAATMAAAPSIPVIVLTGSEAPAIMPDAMRFGVQDYFVKSRVKPAELAEAIARQSAKKTSRSATSLPTRKPLEASSWLTSLRTIRLLIVEDNPGDVVLLRQMLASPKDVRFDIQHAPKLSTAIDLLRNRPDLVLLDLDLPDSVGLDTLQRLRANLRYAPILILTGLEDRHHAVEALASGAQDYFVKGKVDGRLLERAILRHVYATEMSLLEPVLS